MAEPCPECGGQMIYMEDEYGVPFWKCCICDNTEPFMREEAES